MTYVKSISGNIHSYSSGVNMNKAMIPKQLFSHNGSGASCMHRNQNQSSEDDVNSFGEMKLLVSLPYNWVFLVSFRVNS